MTRRRRLLVLVVEDSRIQGKILANKLQQAGCEVLLNRFHAFRLIPVLQLIFRTAIEFTVDSFVQLSPSQREVLRQKMGDTDHRFYRVVPREPTFTKRQQDKVTLERSIFSEAKRQMMLDAVVFVYRASREMPNKSATFQERLTSLRPRLPRVVIEDER